VENSIWSHDAKFIARFGVGSDNNLMTIYSVSNNVIHDQITIEGIDDRFMAGGAISWSPNNNHIAYPESGFGAGHLNFIDLELNQIATTCFIEFFDEYNYGNFQFSWSPDGRYLAFYGLVETETDAETGTIYIYDTQTDIAYEVYTGDARIIGWAKVGDE
jgi:hypothetical protein